MKKNKKIYLDFASTTPLCKEAYGAMKKVERLFANPSSLYGSGVETKKILEDARVNVAQVLTASKEEVTFTSGGTEGNNMVIFGLHKALVEKGFHKLHIVTSTIEHSSILEPVRELERQGVEVTYIRPNNEGVIEAVEIKKVLRAETFLVSIMYVNNEVGTIQPIHEIAKIVRDFNKSRSSKLAMSNLQPITFFHTDACQASNYLNINTNQLGVDFMTLDGGKIYGPKGVGVIFRKKNVPLSPIIYGGGQEKGLRSGTENISLVVGFTEALKHAVKISKKESERVLKLRDYFIKKIIEKIPDVKINGSLEKRIPNNINICIKGLDAEFAVFELDNEGVECSSASTCMNLKGEPESYVLNEFAGAECAKSSLRFTLGRETTKKDLDYCLKAISHILLNQWKILTNNR